MRRFAAALLMVVLAPACVMTVGPQSPRPNIALVPHTGSLQLVLDRSIEDGLQIPTGNNTVNVTGWRHTLAEGFKNGFGSAYSSSSGDSDLTLTLDEVRLEVGDFDHSRARIQFKATLSSRGGILRRDAGIAIKASPMFTGAITTASALLATDVSGAVEAMYEQIAKELFK